MTKRLKLILMLLIGVSTLSFAQDNVSVSDKTKEIDIAGDIAKGMFRMTFHLPNDAKKIIWTVTHENGTLTVKEKYKRMEAGKQFIDYNFKSAPSGMYTFKIVADDVLIATKDVMKSK